MKGEDLIKIYNEFGYEAQLMKLMEEFYEFKAAFSNYKMSFYMERETKDQFIEVLDELNDMVNVAYGIGIVKYGIHCDEIEAMRMSKVARTINIINKMNLTGDSYHEIRERVR